MIFRISWQHSGSSIRTDSANPSGRTSLIGEHSERIERLRIDETCELLLLLDGDRAVGFLQLAVLDHSPFRTPVKKKVGSIDAVFLLPGVPGTGMG